MAVIAVADAALATAPRLSGAVAVAQTVVTVGCAAVLPGRVPIANDAGVLVAGYRAGAWLERRSAVASLVCLALGVITPRLLTAPGSSTLYQLALVVLKNALLPWLVGRYTTARRAYIAELEQRSDRERREARQAMAEAMAEERSAMARDLHDVIAHHVSAIGMHAGAARLAIAGISEESTGATELARSLTAVETSSRAAMLDLRRLLDFLHGNSPDGARQPGLANLEVLLDAVRSAGLTVRLTTDGVPPFLPESLDLAVYRVVQEMLTYALRHGDGNRVDVELRCDGSALTVTSANPVGTEGPEGPLNSAHRGLQGIRSRTAMFHGSAGHGPTPDKTTWITIASFPLDQPLDHVESS
ncbi:sensor histidine kinase [Streptomyces sp. NPDC001848]|uniref:sensor histidine kinase n=1 Tax=Streptomyces sp. NPDC001848 TaxID=3364618 RepID=UPI0036926EC2